MHSRGLSAGDMQLELSGDSERRHGNEQSENSVGKDTKITCAYQLDYVASSTATMRTVALSLDGKQALSGSDDGMFCLREKMERRE